MLIVLDCRLPFADSAPWCVCDIAPTTTVTGEYCTEQTGTTTVSSVGEQVKNCSHLWGKTRVNADGGKGGCWRLCKGVFLGFE